MSFLGLAWVWPAMYLVHVADAPRFVSAARRNASPRSTERDFAAVVGVGLVSTVAAAAVTHADRRTLDLASLPPVVIRPAVFKAAFHAVTTVTFRQSSPGLISSVLTVPRSRRLTRTGIAEGHLDGHDVALCTLVAAAVQVGVVAR